VKNAKRVLIVHDNDISYIGRYKDRRPIFAHGAICADPHKRRVLHPNHHLFMRSDKIVAVLIPAKY
jgi:hypothetical protein